VVLKKINLYIIKLWEKPEKIFFRALCFFEFFYKIGFFLVIRIKKKFGQTKISCKIISVGNLSVGGTGKSLFVLFLTKKYFSKKMVGAILLRGYGRAKKKSEAVEVSSVVKNVGDEALMFASRAPALVVVGRDRVASARLAQRYKKIDYIILDDGYQNFQLKKDREILLIDARAPFGNGHCLPAGPLREKDFSRADVIILTHADEVEVGEIEKIKNNFLKKFDMQKIFTGKHALVNGREIFEKKVLAIAGIGSFSGFINSVEKAGAMLVGTMQFPDHHFYTEQDVKNICEKAKGLGCDRIVTTSKDWQKLKFLVPEKNIFFILEVAFEFLTEKEESNFFRLLSLDTISFRNHSRRTGR
jgi:tetraacyldisaccharide 4'-kinase